MNFVRVPKIIVLTLCFPAHGRHWLSWLQIDIIMAMQAIGDYAAASAN